MGEAERMKDLENEIKFSFLRKVLEELKDDRRNEIHVTDLVYNCIRRAYYSKKYGFTSDEDISGFDEQSMLTLWIGKKLHEIKLSDKHEFEIEFEGIKGSIDEILHIGDELIILDKKTTRKIPSSPYEHHIRQIEYYAAMYYAIYGIDVRYGAVLYIDVANKKSVVHVFTLSGDKEQILKEMIEKKEKLEDAIKNNKVPEAKVSWLCDYCGHFERCIIDGYSGR